jgi:hypothetical protein
LAPAVRDMLREYPIASGNRIRVEILDPKDNAEAETEANPVSGAPSGWRMRRTG